MRELIKEVLNDYVQLLTEAIFFGDRIIVDENKILIIYYNEHSQESIGIESKFARVDIDIILESIRNLKKTIFETTIKARENGRKSVNVRDTTTDGGIDYHMWIKKVKPNLVELIINSSIYLPLQLPGKNSSLIFKTWDKPPKITESRKIIKIVI